METEPFSIAIEEGVLSDLRERIGKTRWPPPSPEAPWAQGTDLGYLRDLLAYWAGDFDWREQEERLNAVEHFRADVDGVGIHYVHVRRGGLPLVLTHGWPSTFVEHLQLVPHLPAFDLVIPSLPGYGFSERPARGRPAPERRRAGARRCRGGVGRAAHEPHAVLGDADDRHLDARLLRHALASPGDPRAGPRPHRRRAVRQRARLGGNAAARVGRAAVRHPPLDADARGGHFAPAEQPVLLAQDIAEFFDSGR